MNLLSRRELSGFLLGFIGIVVFGTTLPATRYAIPALDPYFITFGRAALASICAAAFLLVARPPFPSREQCRDLVIVGLLLVLGFPLFMAIGMATVPASHGGVVLGILPLATATAATFIAKERPSPAFWLAGIAGAGLVVLYAARQSNIDELATGDLALLAAVIFAATGYTMSGRLTGFMSAPTVISWALVFTAPLWFVVSFLLWPANASAVPWDVWTAFLYVAIFSQYLGFFFWNAGLHRGGIARVGQVQLLQIFVTIGVAAWLNKERIDAETILFAVAVVGVVLAGMRTRIRRQ
jgi:drug/metabolite transporter (DMT)-like permease